MPRAAGAQRLPTTPPRGGRAPGTARGPGKPRCPRSSPPPGLASGALRVPGPPWRPLDSPGNGHRLLSGLAQPPGTRECLTAPLAGREGWQVPGEPGTHPQSSPAGAAGPRPQPGAGQAARPSSLEPPPHSQACQSGTAEGCRVHGWHCVMGGSPAPRLSAEGLRPALTTAALAELPDTWGPGDRGHVAPAPAWTRVLQAACCPPPLPRPSPTGCPGPPTWGQWQGHAEAAPPSLSLLPRVTGLGRTSFKDLQP